MKQKYCTLYIVRHGQTDWNVQKLLQGQQDSALTELGITQAKELQETLREIHFDGIFSSDLLRTKKTAEIMLVIKVMKIENLIRYFILLYSFLPLYQGRYLNNPSANPNEEKIINHPEIIIANENSP